jgi:CO/xanthine dehydrogenase FAD-binding subunit
MENFEYIEPKSLEDAVALFAKFKNEAKLLAGGTDLIAALKSGRVKIKYLINLKKIKGLHRIRFNHKEGLQVGALVTWTEILSSQPIARFYPLLREVASVIGCSQIRNMGTIGGNICHASPAADSAPALMVYGAKCLISKRGRDRVIPVEEFFAGVQKISLKPGEILTEFRLPPPDPGLRGCYLKFSPRKAMDLPIVGVGVLGRAENGTFQDVRIALGAVASTPIRARKAEKLITGKPVGEEWILRAAKEAAKESKPISDLRASAEYRRAMVEELTFRAISGSILRNS